MKIKFNLAVTSARGGGFFAGQTIDVAELTPELERFLEPRGDRPPVAYLVRESEGGPSEVTDARPVATETTTVGKSSTGGSRQAAPRRPGRRSGGAGGEE